MKKVIDLTGQKFGRLTVLGKADDYFDSKNRKYPRWECRCDCGNKKIIQQRNLIHGNSKSCGCLASEYKRKKKKENVYEFKEDYIICYAGNTGSPILLDPEDYDLVKRHYWNESSTGYAVSGKSNTTIFMHRLVTHVTDSNIHVDHRYHNNLDNRKNNLRVTDCHHNTMNEKLAINNTSGVTGVSCENGKWRAYLWYKGKTLHFGTYDKKEDAVEARKEAENKYFGEFGIHNSMKPLVEEEGNYDIS